MKTLIPHAGDDACNLINMMLCWDPNKRLTVSQCLQHSYFSSFFPPSRAVSPNHNKHSPNQSRYGFKGLGVNHNNNLNADFNKPQSGMKRNMANMILGKKNENSPDNQYMRSSKNMNFRDTNDKFNQLNQNISSLNSGLNNINVNSGSKYKSGLTNK